MLVASPWTIYRFSFCSYPSTVEAIGRFAWIGICHKGSFWLSCYAPDSFPTWRWIGKTSPFLLALKKYLLVSLGLPLPARLSYSVVFQHQRKADMTRRKIHSETQPLLSTGEMCTKSHSTSVGMYLTRRWLGLKKRSAASWGSWIGGFASGPCVITS